MGGYKRPTLKLIFADPEMDGLEVRAKRLNIGNLFRVAALADMGHGLVQREEKLTELFEALGASITSWNLEEDDDTPVPTTPAGLRGQDMRLLLAITHSLIEASAGVARPLEQPSPGGEPSLEASIPMEVP